MLATKGVPVESYVKDKDGRRFGLSPFLHYPDFCTIFEGKVEGECWRGCSDIPENERPCWLKAHGIEVPKEELGEEKEPEAPKEVKQEKPRREKPQSSDDQVEKLRQELDEFIKGQKAEKAPESQSSGSPDDSDIGVALDALIGQAEAIQVQDKQAAKELRRLVKSMTLLRGRLGG